MSDLMSYQEGDLWREDELVPLEQSAAGVDEHGVRDGVDQVSDPDLQVLVLLRQVDGAQEHHFEGLETKT